MKRVFLIAICFATFLADRSGAAELVAGQLSSKYVSATVPYYTLHKQAGSIKKKHLPLLLFLHGGADSRDLLKRRQAIFESAWKAGRLPDMVIATPSVGKSCNYLDYRDSSQNWESFLMKEFIPHLALKLNVDKKKILVGGVSMGGLGSLRLAFKYPTKFVAVAAVEPGVMPSKSWRTLDPKFRFFYSLDHWKTLHGNPIDEKHWADNQPINLVQKNAISIRRARMKIFLECGNEDGLLLHEGAEALHRALWDARIRHEYRIVDGADHIDETVLGRTADAIEYLGKCLLPAAADSKRENFRNLLDEIKRNGGADKAPSLKE